MIGSVTLSMSRGGFLALLSGAGMLVLVRRARFAWAGTALLTLAAAVALVSWMGGQRVESRLATIWRGEAMQQSRLPLWTDSWPLVVEFPLLGTGYGTFSYVEPLHRAHTASIFVHEHAHNEYLEALVEGGVVRLAISLLVIGLVFRFGYRAVRRFDGAPTGGLALGALFGFTTLVIHSIGDFGLHLPAIALLATVLTAQLVGLGQDEVKVDFPDGQFFKTDEPSAGAEHLPPRTESITPVLSTVIDFDPSVPKGPGLPPVHEKGPPAKAPGAYVFRWGGLAPAAGALTTIALALVLYVEGRRLERVQAYRLMAARLAGQDRSGRPGSAIGLAGSGRPAGAGIGPGFGGTGPDPSRSLRGTPGPVDARSGGRGGGPANRIGGRLVGDAVAGRLGAAGRGDSRGGLERGCRRRAREVGEVPARCRPCKPTSRRGDVCPLMARPHIRLAANQPYLTKADPRTAYLDRAKRLVTNDAELWFLFGAQEYLDGQYPRGKELAALPGAVRSIPAEHPGMGKGRTEGQGPG